MRSRQNTASALESLHVPGSGNAAAATSGPTSTRAHPEWVVGATAIALAVSLVIQNVMVGWTDAPAYWDPIEEVFAWHAENRVVVAIAVGQEALHLLLLLGFLSGLHGLVGRRGGAGADWSRLAVAAGATLSAIYVFYAATWIGAVLAADELAEPSPVFELAWQMHAAGLAMSLSALGATFIGAAMAAHASRLTPQWQRLLGVAGGGLLLAAGAASLAIADGSTFLLVGLPGLAAWIVWLLVTGARLVRARTAERRGAASASGETD